MDRPGRRRPGRPSRTALAGVVLLAAGLALTACSSDSSPGGSGGKPVTEITFWDNNGGPDRTPLWQKVIKEFEAANPTIKINYTAVKASQVVQRYNSAILTGTTPDVGGATTSYLSGLIAQNALEPLDERVTADGLDTLFIKSFADSVRTASADAKLYEVPTSGNLDVLWYRTDLFRAANLQPPSTWADFFSDARKLTDRGQRRHGFTIRGGTGAIFQLLAEMYSYSGVTSFFDDEGQSTVDAPANIEAVRKIAELYGTATPESDLTNDFSKMVAAFGTQDIAMMHHNLGSTKNNKAVFGDRVAAVPLPIGGARVRTVVPNPVDGLVLFKAGRHKDAAWKFISFAFSRAQNSAWNQAVGQIPANTDASADAWLQGSQPVRDVVKVLNDPTTITVQPPYHLPEFAAITKGAAEAEYQNVLTGKLAAKTFLNGLAEKLTLAEIKYRARTPG